jgi:hypothetical protein
MPRRGGLTFLSSEYPREMRESQRCRKKSGDEIFHGVAEASSWEIGLEVLVEG